jgi:hypothetical protein
MHSPARLILPFLLAAAMTHVAFGQVPSRDGIGAARDLYASARYDEALAVLNDLRPTEAPGTADLKSVEQYRSLCLLALGRGQEAETAIAAVVTADPAYLPNDAEASPRVRAAFSDVRKKLLPEIAAKRYTDAKALFDRKDYVRATAQFKQVIALLDDPDMGGRNSDLRTLASGFLDLAIAATPPPEPPKPAPVIVAPAPAPVVPQPDPNKVYTVADSDVVPPITITQDVPRMSPIMKQQARARGVIEVVIDEQGRVIGISMRESIQPMYDAEVVTKGRDWRYQPATLNGKPVKYRKLIQLNISKN